MDYSNRVNGKKVGAGQCGDLMKDWFITETGRQQLANDLDEWGYFPGTGCLYIMELSNTNKLGCYWI
ncbi:hypothetical protein ACYYIR_06050 [Lactococcus garvieae]|uniref:hypothetical protein n=1 Tax=Lactococcus garvieae TaxID=1363 RepID=UPI001E4879D0|nr:hypothetical protein [Lactococcus garvieae]